MFDVLSYFLINSIFEEKWQKAQQLLHFTLNIHSISPFLVCTESVKKSVE